MDQRRRNDLINQDYIRCLSGDRKTFSISLLYQTWKLIDRLVETGAGKFGSAFIEHSIRFFVACLSGSEDNMELVIEGLLGFVVTSNFSDNLRRFADAWDEKRGDIEIE